jgi:hypothetical protein
VWNHVCYVAERKIGSGNRQRDRRHGGEKERLRVTSHGDKLIATNYYARNPFSLGAAAIQCIFLQIRRYDVGRGVGIGESRSGGPRYPRCIQSGLILGGLGVHILPSHPDQS